ncbi:hypothetical protein [Deinococcus sedimenti]|uniref:Transposase n=1 Tax=Deinococcus sedimenti TaxID=1867090 RepID=A0ABQ2S1J2_9DEIO|nr:hypothetical protein [Deinococcus sedimenti]GGR84415.1 hypothetical protein GCM10008960_09330 [Deinococcus sedimenti]
MTISNAKPYRIYTEREKIEVLIALRVNGGNMSRTERETGVSRATLREWSMSPLAQHPEVTRAADEKQRAFISSLESTRDSLVARMNDIAQNEKDLFKLSGAFKIVTEAISNAEMSMVLTEKLRAAMEAADEESGAGMN